MIGLAIAIHTEEAEDIGERCRKQGLLVAPEEDVLLVIPALNIDVETLDEGLSILTAALA